MEVEYDVMMKPEEETVTPREKTNSGSGGGSHNHYSRALGLGSNLNYNMERESKSNSDRRMVDITRDKPIKVAVRVVVPVRDHPKFNFVGKLLGPKGNSLKRLQEDTMCKMAVLGRGSMKDRHKEEELRASGDPKFQHLSEELHVEISAFATPAEAHARIAYALAEVRRFLVPDYNDDIRQEQMWEMQVLSTQKNAKEGNGSNGGVVNAADGAGSGIQQGSLNPSGPGSTGGSPAGSAGGDCPSTGSEDSMNGGHNEGGDSPSAITTGEHPALRGVQQVGGAGSPPSSTVSGAAVTGVGRKRPLLAGGPRTSMTPTKRTVMSLLARARAAQAKQLPATFQRAPENMVADSFSITGTDTTVASISNFPRATTLVPLLREDYLTGAVNLNLI